MIKLIIIGIVLIIILTWTITKNVLSISRKKKLEKEYHRRKEELRLRKIEEQKKSEEKKRIIDEKIQSKTVIIPPKKDWQIFERTLDTNKVEYLYHFTDKANIESILNSGGLCSWDFCERNNIIIPKPGGSLSSRDLDRRKNLENYVRICFVKDHPMLFVAKSDGRIQNPVLLKISKEVIYWNNTKYSDINAVTERIQPKIGNTIDHFTNINFSIFNKNYFDLDYTGKMQYQAEVLAYERIPINYILNIYDFC